MSESRGTASGLLVLRMKCRSALGVGRMLCEAEEGCCGRSGETLGVRRTEVLALLEAELVAVEYEC